jgi:hypothetical protein
VAKIAIFENESLLLEEKLLSIEVDELNRRFQGDVHALIIRKPEHSEPGVRNYWRMTEANQRGIMVDDSQIQSPLRVRSGRWLSYGWDTFWADLGINVLIALLVMIFVSFIPLVAGPVAAGLALAGIRKIRNSNIDVKDFFDGFRFFLPAFLSSLLILAFSVVGLIFLIVPGLVILAMYMFTFHFMVDRSLDFWTAMESSRKLVSRDYFGFVLFGLLLGLINFAGLLFFGIGLLVSLPVSWLALARAYEDLEALPAREALLTGPVRID